MAANRNRSGNKRSQGAGAIANNEPRVQTFKGFTGLDFEHSTSPVPITGGSDGLLGDDNGWLDGNEQSDLVMTALPMMSNAVITDNLSIETIPQMKYLFKRSGTNDADLKRLIRYKVIDFLVQNGFDDSNLESNLKILEYEIANVKPLYVNDSITFVANAKFHIPHGRYKNQEITNLYWSTGDVIIINMTLNSHSSTASNVNDVYIDGGPFTYAPMVNPIGKWWGDIEFVETGTGSMRQKHDGNHSYRNSRQPQVSSINLVNDRLVVLDTFGNVWRSEQGRLQNIPFSQAFGYGRMKLYPPTTLYPTAAFTGAHETGGSLTLTTSQTSTNKYRVVFSWSLKTTLGVTNESPKRILWANIPFEDWSSENWADFRITGLGGIGDAEEPLVDAGGSNEPLVIVWVSVGDSNDAVFAACSRFISTDEVYIRVTGYQDDFSVDSSKVPKRPTMDNTTLGPGYTHMTKIDGRLYFYGAANNYYECTTSSPIALRYRYEFNNDGCIGIGGNQYNPYCTNIYAGGGTCFISSDEDVRVNSILKYKTVSGADAVCVLTGGRKNHRNDKRYNLVKLEAGVNDTMKLTTWEAEEVYGATGCKYDSAAIACEDGLYTINDYAMMVSTMVMEYNNQIRVVNVSDPVRQYFADNHDVVNDSNPSFTAHTVSGTSSGLTTFFRFRGADMPYQNACLCSFVEIDGVLYVHVSNGEEHKMKRSFVMCYDIDAKAWYSLFCANNNGIKAIFDYDYVNDTHGLGILMENMEVVLMPISEFDSYTNDLEDFHANGIVETAWLATAQPTHGLTWLSQIQFQFDYVTGPVRIEVVVADVHGRKLTYRKDILSDEMRYGVVECMRIDAMAYEYKVRIKTFLDTDTWLVDKESGRYRLDCFNVLLFTKSNRHPLRFGFDESVSYRSNGDMHPTFKEYSERVLAATNEVER